MLSPPPTVESGREDSVPTAPDTGISVSLTDLTSYIEQLRTFLPKPDKSGVGGVVGEGVVGKGGMVGPMTYVDQALVKAWNQMTSKARDSIYAILLEHRRKAVFASNLMLLCSLYCATLIANEHRMLIDNNFLSLVLVEWLSLFW